MLPIERLSISLLDKAEVNRVGHRTKWLSQRGNHLTRNFGPAALASRTVSALLGAHVF